ncbi:MAG: (2Fe-2S)-binding protein [Gammaproteobacteria bacterium]
MIVCICNAVTERDIDEAIAAGATSATALREQLAVSSQCGSCRDCVEACLDRALCQTQSVTNTPLLFSPEPQSLTA